MLIGLRSVRVAIKSYVPTYVADSLHLWRLEVTRSVVLSFCVNQICKKYM